MPTRQRARALLVLVLVVAIGLLVAINPPASFTRNWFGKQAQFEIYVQPSRTVQVEWSAGSGFTVTTDKQSFKWQSHRFPVEAGEVLWLRVTGFRVTDDWYCQIKVNFFEKAITAKEPERPDPRTTCEAKYTVR